MGQCFGCSLRGSVGRERRVGDEKNGQFSPIGVNLEILWCVMFFVQIIWVESESCLIEVTKKWHLETSTSAWWGAKNELEMFPPFFLRVGLAVCRYYKKVLRLPLTTSSTCHPLSEPISRKYFL